MLFISMGIPALLYIADRKHAQKPMKKKKLLHILMDLIIWQH